MRWILCMLMVLISCAMSEAGLKAVTRESSRTQSHSNTYGHFVTIPNGLYEGVAVAPTRRQAIDNACYSNDCSKTAVKRSVTRGPGGMFHSSVLYRSR